MEHYMVKTDYSVDGKENLRKSLINHRGKNSEWLFKNVLQVLQPGKTSDVIRIRGITSRTKGFEMQAGTAIVYMDKTSYLK